MQIQSVSSPVLGRVLPTSTAPQAPIAQPAQTLPIKDSLQISPLRGAIPASMSLFAASSPIDRALQKLNSHPSEANFKDTQAAFRVTLRSLSVSELEALVAQLEDQINQTRDYRSQVFLDRALVDTRMEIYTKGGKPNFPEPTMPPLPGNEPQSIVQNSLKQLDCHPSEANFRTSQAGFRVAIRDLSLDQLKATEALVAQAMDGSSSYRTQKLLSGLMLDVKLEIARKGGQPGFPEPTMPPVPGNEPQSIVANTLKQLNSSPTEANYRTAEAGFRVALRSLNATQLKDTEKLVQAAIQNNSDYRAQKLLDALLLDLKLEAKQR
ncbi:hypothetical protein COW36_15810 [bacterium (Candidatus Blackallbacteria) CG17_big_fil_post_rev_8_21_14_2_50_48_46]|uniref:Uncharacterized protein n=1 Tax=bacterium (Candidatus Blackallbacteria) CG17_big_fil_post_rev_8_21_14_2_50_48_46 TaxID=2014261 RepID=A0A2M7G211_9BACT|nr:MAG: hypothetical protein COW64_24300 [bacterium (Candidatus Blackallbacteria) CG18_big_fil_WC_8_21_14_2_50_49_26]PIW15809.1 MAG: hypothetical protein COW36_15810 [bacterium (Candidatus Blackallbacteria) CG17_big_fil_post_rev_8_21_14_2_50_48_46]PIW47794.1 MAG: hypothetical protein COW20_11505 [bacterium (Candidatus Blackallbacteria) CG13_big_fil_rev_8_21_14_2_50_49_14]